MNDSEKQRTSESAPWVVIAGGVHCLGGTDKANFALVEYLLERDIPVEVVAHEIDRGLLRHPNIRAHLVPVPGGSRFAGEILLSLLGRRVAHRTTRKDPNSRVIVNGGNCPWGDINWVHRVHHAWAPEIINAPWVHRLKHHMAVASAKRRELQSLRAARLIIANSELTRRHLVELLGLDPKGIETVRLGSDPDCAPSSNAERLAARSQLRQPAHRPMVVFIGAIGYDNNKGLDTLLRAWRDLCCNPQWDADLVIAGDGRALPQWKAMVARSGFHDRVRFLGFTDRIHELLAAADLLVSPVRYESYGLNVQEALCRGVPAIVSVGAGVAERYPSNLRDLLLPDPENVDDLVYRMLIWRSSVDNWRERVAEFSKELRTYSWQDMAERFYRLAIHTESEMSEASAVHAIAGGTK